MDTSFQSPFTDPATADTDRTNPAEITRPPDYPGTASASEVTDRLAAMVASGETPFPEDLDLATQARVMAQVRRLRRERLVKLIARVIAQRLVDGDHAGKENIP